MIDISYEDALAKVVEESGKSQDEIEKQVEAKLEQLSGLISKDGAIHIIANELNVQLTAPAPAAKELKIADISLESRNLTVNGKVVQKWDVNNFNKNGREGRVANLLIGDDSGVTKLVFWNDQVDVFEELKVGDILVVQNPFVKESYKGDRLELQLNQQSQLTVNPEGVTVETREAPQQRERTQKYIKDLAGGENDTELIATVVQVYDPRFYDACPECRKKVEGNMCATHGEVTPEVNFNMSAFLDDGTGNIRTSFWKQQAMVLTGKTEEEFVKFREDLALFEPVKTALLGEIIKVVGSVKKNETFDRLEFTAQLVFTDVDPAKEIENLEKKFEADRQAKAEAPADEKPAEEAPAVEATPEPAQETTAEEPKEPEQKETTAEKLVVEEDVISLDDLEEMGK